MSGVMKHTMVVRNPDTMVATALLKGEPLPAWATDLVDADNLESAAAAKASKDNGPAPVALATDGSGTAEEGYGSKSPADLKAEAEARGLTVEGTGKDNNVLKGDLVAALEADDAAKAS